MLTGLVFFVVILNGNEAMGSKPVEGCDDLCQNECLSIHNKYRANYDAPRVELDPRLAEQAQQQIANGVLAHSERMNEGESIAWGSLFPTFTSAIKSWHDERVNFDFKLAKPKNEALVYKNFAQIVWKGVRKLGCARGLLYGKPWYIVHYDTAPNMEKPGQVRQNIGKPKEDDMSWFRDSSPFAKDFENPDKM